MRPMTRSADRTGPRVEELSQSYDRDGFVVLDRALSSAEVDELRAETVRVCRGELGHIGGALEPEPTLDDDEVLRRYLCVHYPHKLSAVMSAAMGHPAVVSALTALIGPDVKSMQSMLFIKAEGKPGQAWHQDEHFIPTRDRSLTAAWIALDDATVENGCLWVLPGSHRPGVLYPNREQNDPRFDCTVESFDFPYADTDAVAVEVPAGSVLLFNGYLLHRSLPNSGGHGYRRALVNHYMSASSLLPWGRPDKSVPTAAADFRDISMVAGRDPYAYKGVQDIRRPYIRPDGDGGCDQ